MSVAIRPNKKSRIGKIEVTCYGEDMIMVDHYTLPAPKPVGPKNTERFWSEFSDLERAEKILDYLDAKIDWAESSPDLLLSLGRDIDKARSSLN